MYGHYLTAFEAFLNFVCIIQNLLKHKQMYITVYIFY